MEFLKKLFAFLKEAPVTNAQAEDTILRLTDSLTLRLQFDQKAVDDIAKAIEALEAKRIALVIDMAETETIIARLG